MTSTTTTSSRRRWPRALLGLVAVVLLGAAPSAAQDATDDAATDGPPPAAFAVQPSGPDGPGSRDWFTYTLDPGEVFGDTVAVSNLGDVPTTFRIYATDAVSVADVGGFSALRDDQDAVDVGTWITLATNEYTVDPGKRIDVPFSIEVPDDAEPGDHAGAILAIDTAQLVSDDAPDGLSFDVIQRLGARVYVRVGGETAPALRVDELSIDRAGSSATLTWEVSNTGNLRLEPTAEVRITGFMGRTVRTVPVQQLPELLPGANFIGGTALSGLPSYERLTAHLVVKAEGVEVERSLGFGSYPWLLLAGVLLLLLGGLWLRRRRRAHRARRASGGAPPSSSPRVPVAV